MTIRPAATADLPAIFRLYEEARDFMRRSGNPRQWKTTEPRRETVEEDLRLGRLYLCVEGETLLAAFCFFIGEDPTYRTLLSGAWLNERPYGVIHRIAVANEAKGRGVAAACFAYGFSRCGNLKIDTHRDNRPMQRALEKNGFVFCGTVRLENGEERMGFQKEA